LRRISIVIATLGRPALLARTLDRLERQASARHEFEVVVASDAAEEDVDAVARTAAARPYPVRHVVAETPGVSAARNRGWRAADAPLILFIGDDMLPGRTLVSEHLRTHERNPAEEFAVLGHVRWARDLRVTAFMRWLERGIQFDYPSISGAEAGWWHFYAANGSLKRSRLELTGGFDESFRFGYEELDLAIRMREIGLRVLYNRRAMVEHLHPTTIDSWRERMRTVATAERQFVNKHPHVDPYFMRMFEAAAAQPRAHGRGARLAALVPRRWPLVGERVWQSADAYFAQQLAPAFLTAWHASAPHPADLNHSGSRGAPPTPPRASPRARG
jgi:GT2 family glycosyltransferase